MTSGDLSGISSPTGSSKGSSKTSVCNILMLVYGLLLLSTYVSLIFCIISRPSATWPNIVCLPLSDSKLSFDSVMKN